MEFPHESFRSKSEGIDSEDVRYYHTERCIEAGEEYDPELKWLDSEVDHDRSSGGGSGVLEGSSSEYASPPSFASSSSVHLEEGMRQMSEVISGMSEMALSDQGSHENPVKNTWKGLKKGEIATSNYPWFNGEVYFGHPDVPTL